MEDLLIAAQNFQSILAPNQTLDGFGGRLSSHFIIIIYFNFNYLFIHLSMCINNASCAFHKFIG